METARNDLDVERIAERLFSVYEVSLLRSLSKSERLRAFLRIWTHKEAYLKAKGSGLADSLDSFTIFVDPNRPYGRVQIDDPLENVRWTLQELRLHSEFVGTLAVEGADGQLVPPVPITWKTADRQ